MPLLQTTDLTKIYPGVRALDGVDFELARGEVHVLFGENGAGKSTLISILAGANTPSSGAVRLEDQAIQLRSVRDGRAHGICAVFQEFSLVPTLTVGENLFLGDEPTRFGWLDSASVHRQARVLLDSLGFQINEHRKVSSLARSEQQMVEIAKGLRTRPKVLILDEPTASLTERETEQLFDVVRRLRKDGVGVIYISHRMQEIDLIADRITVLRDGKCIGTVKAGEVSHDALIEMMTGRDVQQLYPDITSSPGDTVIELQNVSTVGGVRNANITVRKGEVLGIAGLVGSGKSELMRAVYGLEQVTQGHIRFGGQLTTHASPAAMLKAGMFYLPPDRKSEGLVLGFESNANIVLDSRDRKHRSRWGLLNLRRRLGLAEQASKRVELAPRNMTRAVGLLSGGNQQKVMFAKGLVQDAMVYVFDEPTVGVDVGTRASLYRLIKSLCESGAAVVVISSDLPEVLHLAHRAYVMCAGRVTGELTGDAICESKVLGLFFQRH
ncbi:monosaccharide ABC transporter ATP-binding protein (CUT2 family) [Acidovorax temperans]|uniref:Monosaccharide ABC transporter ATP-binding protein (CUT2 family) n=1 Tax=Acidovorax temperans TaxID=80878 RepID=A0A543L832_9BURK|nr:sugar ABC transporter ATP-binding protein [Acidovorax temperans]TQN03481.1 monosaccharide ABC transporter ATP-binding protein (CUT2 family) [Acidovorax temperans]